MCLIDATDDQFTLYHRNHPRARKEHQCDECRRTIGKGELYLHATGLYDGRWDNYHICAHCEAAAEWLMKNCGGWIHGGIEEDLREHFYEPLPGTHNMWLGRALVGIKRKWRQIRGSDMMPLLNNPPIFDIPISH